MTRPPLRWLADENLHNGILRALRRRAPHMDILRVQDLLGVAGLADVPLLEWATSEDRVILTQDVSTMVPARAEVLRRQGRCTPLVLVTADLPLGTVIEDILLLDEFSIDADWAAGVIHLPLG